MTSTENAPEKRARSSHKIPTVFGPEAVVTEPFDADTVRDVLYSGLCPSQGWKHSKTAKVDEEWNMRMKCFQDWFLRCSWTNKFLFLEILCNSTRGCLVMEKVLKTISVVFTKDVIDSLANESTDFDYDRIPADDNRALDSRLLKQVMKNDFIWFVNQEPKIQAKIILRLLRLGGGGLIFSLFKTAQNIYRERRSVLHLLSKVPSVKDTKNLEAGDTSSSDSTSTLISVKTKNLSQKRINQLVRRDEELQFYRQSKRISSIEEQSQKKKEPFETIDYLQLLPIDLNRKIMSYVDGKTLPDMKKVGKYWGKMIDELINEKTGRKTINAKINKIIEVKGEPKESSSTQEKPENEEFEVVVESQDKTLINRKIEDEGDRLSSWRLYRRVFSKKCSLTELDNYGYVDRCCVLDNVIGTLACSSPNNSLHFYSIRTGDKLHHTIFNLESSITCIALHPNRTHMFIGCRNGSLVCRNIRTNKDMGLFRGHSKAVISVLVTESNLLSSSKDNTIKFFQLWSGLCLLCVDLTPEYNVSCALITNDESPLSAIGTKEGVLILVDLIAKKFMEKVKIHKSEIKQMVHDSNILITGSRDGKIRIWDIHNLDKDLPILKPFYDIDVESPVRSLTLYKNQIISGCDNGTLKIISLATGNIFKILKISSQTPILGSAIAEDKARITLIIWHEGGIEVRTFLFSISDAIKKSKGRESRQEKPRSVEHWMSRKKSGMVCSGFVRSTQPAIFPSVKCLKTTTFSSKKAPLQTRCCTLPGLRKVQPHVREFRKDVFTQMLNDRFSGQFFLKPFPRYKNFISNKK